MLGVYARRMKPSNHVRLRHPEKSSEIYNEHHPELGRERLSSERALVRDVQTFNEPKPFQESFQSSSLLSGTFFWAETKGEEKEKKCQIKERERTRECVRAIK